MAKNLLNKSCCLKPGIFAFLSVKKIILIQLIILAIFFQGCTFLTSRKKTEKYFTRTDIENIIKNFKEQEDTVSKFYSKGKLTFDGWIIDKSVDVFIAGKKDPLMYKIETHVHGKPIFYILIKKDKLEIRDFREKIHYTGIFTADNLSKYLQGMDLSPDLIWPLLRGCPHFNSYSHIYEGETGVLFLEDSKKNRVGTITLSPGEGIKKAVSSPPRFHRIVFTDFQKTGDIGYAEKTVVEDVKGRKDMVLKRKTIVFNKDIPDAIFTLKNKPYFEVISLDDI